MPTSNELDLSQFTGTEHYHRWSMLFPNFVLTDGAKYVAETCGAYWLMDAIASYYSRYKDEPFVIAVLDKNSPYHGGWTLRLVDDIPSSTVFATQKIEFSDFPLDEIKFYVLPQEEYRVILLPGEY